MSPPHHPLSCAQRGFWLLYKLRGEMRGSYNPAFCARVVGGLDADRLQGALDTLARRHPALRTRFIEIDGDPRQCVEPRVAVPLRVQDAGELEASGLERILVTDATRPFDLSCAPLLRASLYRLGDGGCLLLLVFDHIVCDGKSFLMLVDELGDILAGTPSSRGDAHATESSYLSYVQWQRDWLDGEQARRQLAYWRSALAQEYPCLDIPTDRPPTPGASCELGTVPFALSLEVTAGLRKLARAHRTSLYTIVLAGYFILLHRLSGQAKIAVGSPMPGRDNGRWAETAGNFVNAVVLRAVVEDDMTVADLVRALREPVMHALAKQFFPLTRLVEELNPSRQAGDRPFFQTTFTYQNAGSHKPLLGLLLGLRGAAVRWGGRVLQAYESAQIASRGASSFALEVVEFEETLHGRFHYASALFDTATIERHSNHWTALLAAMAADDGQRVSEEPSAPLQRTPASPGRTHPMTALDGLTVAERERLLAQARQAKLKRQAPEGERITRVPRDGPLPLSYAQQRLWFLAQLEGTSTAAYHIGGGVRLTGPLDLDALRGALDGIVARHEALRTRFVEVEGQPRQIIDDAAGGFRLRETDLREDPDAGRDLARLTDAEALEPFDLAQGPLVRGHLARLADHEHVLLVTMHHIVSDGWSLGLLVGELRALYEAFAAGRSDPLPPLPLQYADYAAWQRRWPTAEVLQQQATYWKDALAGAPALLELPTDRPRPAQPDHAGAALDVVLDEPLTRALKALGRCHDSTLYMTLLAGWALTLARLAGQDDVVVGGVVANRARAEIEPLIGMFVNTLALRIATAAEPASTVSGLLSHVRAQVLAAQQHQDISFEQVVEAVQPPRTLAHAPLFQVLLAWQQTPPREIEVAGLRMEILPRSHAGAQYDLTLSLADAGDRIEGSLEYATALFERGTVERYVSYWKELLRGLVQAEPNTPLAALEMLPAREREQLLHDWNDTQSPYPSACVHELFEMQVAHSPEACALKFEDSRLSYAELNARANRVAHRLLALGVGPDDRVAVCMARGPWLVAALLGVLKSGACYVPLDPAYPADRLAGMVDDSAPKAVLVDERRPPWCDSSVPCVPACEGEPQLRAQADTDPEVPALTPSHAAYVIYTSGSTGRPKGVVVEHRQVVNFLASMARVPGLRRDDVLLAVTTVGFDIAGLELFLPLSQGATIVLARREDAADAQALQRLLREHAVTMMQATPVTWRMLLAAGWTGSATLKVLCGGEALTTELSAQLQARVGEVWNVYGPTETTIWSTCKCCDVAAAGGVESLGRPIANTRVYVLDARLKPVPVGVAGEIHIGGEGVARGYLNRRELTDEKFVADPFDRRPAARMYKTGDLGRWNADGTLAYLGRNDFQVKIRGFRIELGEIEAGLREVDGVREAVVLAREDVPGDRRLVAYCSGEQVSVQTLRAHLSARLPEYMVPVAYVHLETLPRTPNGKLDRRALPAPEGEACGGDGFVAPTGETEEQLARLWADVLGIERVGRHDHFFEIGGHSLLAIKVLNRVRQDHDVELALRDLYEAPRLSSLAERIVGLQLEQFNADELSALMRSGQAA